MSTKHCPAFFGNTTETGVGRLLPHPRSTMLCVHNIGRCGAPSRRGRLRDACRPVTTIYSITQFSCHYSITYGTFLILEADHRRPSYCSPAFTNVYGGNFTLRENPEYTLATSATLANTRQSSHDVRRERLAV